MLHPTDRIAHSTAIVIPVVEHWLEREIAQWVHHEGSIRRPSHHVEFDQKLLIIKFIIIIIIIIVVGVVVVVVVVAAVAAVAVVAVIVVIINIIIILI